MWKNNTIIVLVLIEFLSCNDNSSNTQREALNLLSLEREAIQREFQNDTAFLSSVMDTTFIELSKDRIKNKHEVLKTIFQNNINKSENKILNDSFHLENPVVHLYDNTAVVTFIMRTYNHNNDSTFERRTRFYDVWVKRGDQWKALTWQASSLD